jgi:hypothetical protein
MKNTCKNNKKSRRKIKKTLKRQLFGGQPYNIRDNVNVFGIIKKVNDDDTVDVVFTDKSFSKTEVRNIPNSKVTFIRPGRVFTVRPIQPEENPAPATATAPATAPKTSRFRVKKLPSYLHD